VTFGRGEVGDIVQQCRMAVRPDFGVTEFARLASRFGGHHLAAQLLRHRLHAVADAKNRNAQFKDNFGARGVSPSVTEFGPPDRMMPCAP
jgi:hypothetical protein